MIIYIIIMTTSRTKPYVHFDTRRLIHLIEGIWRRHLYGICTRCLFICPRDLASPGSIHSGIKIKVEIRIFSENGWSADSFCGCRRTEPGRLLDSHLSRLHRQLRQPQPPSLAAEICRRRELFHGPTFLYPRFCGPSWCSISTIVLLTHIIGAIILFVEVRGMNEVFQPQFVFVEWHESVGKEARASETLCNMFTSGNEANQSCVSKQLHHYRPHEELSIVL